MGTIAALLVGWLILGVVVCALLHVVRGLVVAASRRRVDVARTAHARPLAAVIAETPPPAFTLVTRGDAVLPVVGRVHRSTGDGSLGATERR